MMITKINYKILIPLAVSLWLPLLPQTAPAAVVSTSTPVDTFSDSGALTRVPVSGLNQFDASLGVLTGITFVVDIDTYQADISLSNYDDEGSSALFDSATLSAQISLTVPRNSGGGLLFASVGFGGEIFDEFDSISVGPTSASVSEDATTRLQADNLFSNFIGAGAIDFIEFGIFAFSRPGAVVLDDGTTVSGETSLDSFSVGPSTVRIDYTFTPTVIPVPAAGWLFGSGLIGLMGYGCSRRRK